MTKKRTPRDYKFIRLIGEGSFSSVYLAVEALAKAEKSSKIRKYAIKVCQKNHIKRQNKQAAIMREKEIMNVLNYYPSEHFIRLYCTFQDTERLYFVMTYAENGELLDYMQKHPLSLCSVRKYTLQLISALEHIHKLGIVHRDLKPENILLDEQLNILISDFGSAQIYPELAVSENITTSAATAATNRRNSFVGTAQYVSPEMLKNRIATNKSDLWALGVIIYQMITNVMPFNGPNEYLIYQKIQNLDYEFTENFDHDARDIVTSLIKLEPDERLGAKDDLSSGGYSTIRRHKFLLHDISISESDQEETNTESSDKDLESIDKINPGLDEAQLLRLLVLG